MRVLSIYSRVPSAGKKTLAMNLFWLKAQQPGQRILIVDFSITEKLQYSLSIYGTSQFTSIDFLSDIPSENLLAESLTVVVDETNSSFLKILPSTGYPLFLDEDETHKLSHRIKDLFFKNLIDLLVFILPPSLGNRSGNRSISVNAILESDLVFLITSDKFPSLQLTKSTLQKFFTFVNAHVVIFLNNFFPPFNPKHYDNFIRNIEDQLKYRIFYAFPWCLELGKFSSKGIFLKENPTSKRKTEFQEILNLIHEVDKEEAWLSQYKEEEEEESPIALFITEKDSGTTMFYYFFGTAEKKKIKNPVLISAAMMGIAKLVSETAGRKGDLRYIDNGDVKIIQRRGKKVIGILYCRLMTTHIVDLLTTFIRQFEKNYKKQIEKFGDTGIVDFPDAKELVENIFEQYIFRITTVNPKLETLISEFAEEHNLIHEDSEEVFRSFVLSNFQDEEILQLTLYEFLTPHNERHEFLLAKLPISPYKFKDKLENETERTLCWCAKPPEYVQVEALDTLTILSLPEEVRPTARALLISDVLTTELAAKITNRDPEIEQKALETLKQMGYVTITNNYMKTDISS